MTLAPLTSDLLTDVRHGFFTRAGGASTGLFAGLNCGTGSTDRAVAVTTNRERVAEAMDAPLAGLSQIHSADVVTVDAPPDPKPEADGIVTTTPGLALTILTADCMPVLFHAPDGVIGAAHAGWRGALGGVLEATIDAMVAAGAARDGIVAAIGPSISQRAYEVGPDFADAFAEDPEAMRFFANGKGDRHLFDLPGYGLHRLRAAGITAGWTGHCTYSDPDRFYSYRRATHAGEADYGRLIAAIRL